MKWDRQSSQLALRLEGWRARTVLVLIALAFAGLAGRAVYLQAWNTDFLQAKGEARFQRVVDLPASRGTVADRNGAPVAVSTPVESIWASPEDVPEDRETIGRLAKALDMPAKELRQKLSDKDKNFVFLKRQIAPERAQRVMAMKVPGVFQQREYKRYYPQAEVMAHVVGFTGVDDHGQEGIELAHEKLLAGRAGSRRVIKDRKGRIVEDVEFISPPKDGQAITLSLDQRLQSVAYTALKSGVAEHGAKGGAAVILDAKSGEVLALVNQPDYNPNNRARVGGAKTRNRSVTDLFEPGSTIKPFSLAAALEAGIVTPRTSVQTGQGSWTITGGTITDTRGHGTLTVAEVLQHSSNIGTAKIALQLPPERLWNLYRDLGYGQVPATGFPGEAAGKLRPHASWRPIEHATMSYGYGLSVSLLQLARAYTVWTNDGVLLPVSFIKRDSDLIGKRVVSEKTAREINRMLEMATGTGGTAPKAQIAGYRIAGKTGTARKHRPGGGYEDKKHVVSFVGYAPASNPRYIVAVMVDEPTSEKYYGGDVAAPIFAQIMARALALGAVPLDNATGGLLEAKSPQPEVPPAQPKPHASTVLQPRTRG